MQNRLALRKSHDKMTGDATIDAISMTQNGAVLVPEASSNKIDWGGGLGH